MLITLLFLATLFLAYSNGANDNFKGVATLYGSGLLSYRQSLSLATVATFLGSICAIFLAQELVASFSGKGLVSQEVAGSAEFLLSVGLGAACAVMLATRMGYPISTTHSLVGGLLGAGIMAIGMEVNFSRLSNAFVIPLIVSPFIAFALGATVYWLLHKIRTEAGLNKEPCVCVGEEKSYVPIRLLPQMQSEEELPADGTNEIHSPLKLTIANDADCVELYTDKYWGVSVQKLVNAGHIVSAAAVSFARGLNDTPKIAGLLVAINAFDINLGMVAIATGIAIGGWLNARRVAETISNKITTISHGQGFSANLVTSFLVIVASKFGVPVSTTHVSVGSIFGISALCKTGDVKVIRDILFSWLLTLPVAMAFSAIVYFALTQLGLNTR